MTDHSDQPAAAAADDDFPPLQPGELPVQLQDALRNMSRRGQGRVVDGTGRVFAENGRLADDGKEMPRELQEALAAFNPQALAFGDSPNPVEPGQDDGQRVACAECARAIAMGWWGATARHPAPSGAPVCGLCLEGEAAYTEKEWFALTQQLIIERIRAGQRRTWRDDAVIGLGIRQPGE